MTEALCVNIKPDRQNIFHCQLFFQVEKETWERDSVRGGGEELRGRDGGREAEAGPKVGPEAAQGSAAAGRGVPGLREEDVRAAAEREPRDHDGVHRRHGPHGPQLLPRLQGPHVTRIRTLR